MDETPMNIKNAKKLVQALRLVAADAEDRAKEFRQYVTMLDDATSDPQQLEMLEAGWLMEPQTAYDILERINAVCYIHSGSTEASHMRRAQRELFMVVGGKELRGW